MLYVLHWPRKPMNSRLDDLLKHLRVGPAVYVISRADMAIDIEPAVEVPELTLYDSLVEVEVVLVADNIAVVGRH